MGGNLIYLRNASLLSDGVNGSVRERKQNLLLMEGEGDNREGRTLELTGGL